MRDFEKIQNTAKQISDFNQEIDRVESEMFAILMHTTGVYSIRSKNDIWLLAKRVYIIYGNYISTELLLMKEQFFRFFEGEFPEENMDIGEFMMNTLQNGICRELYTYDLIKIIGFAISPNLSQLSELEFTSKAIPEASNHWIMDREVFLFPGTNRNYKMRKRIREGGGLSNEEINQAEQWANLVVKYI